MLSECGGYALNYNAELYNAVELRRLLEHESAVFHRRCDTEVVLPALMHWGDAALEPLQRDVGACVRRRRAAAGNDAWSIAQRVV